MAPPFVSAERAVLESCKVFDGFGPNALPFLKALAFHQTREWFEANKTTFESDLKGPMGELVEDLTAAFAKAKIPLKGDRKTSVFRIHRDVRFAKDKNPYKTNHGAVLTRTGSKSDPGLFYVHVAPEGCFTAAGFYGPEPDKLAKLRGAMAGNPRAWKSIFAKLAKSSLALDDEFAMSRNPRGFDGVEDAEILAALRLKSLIVRRPLAAARIGERGLIDDLQSFARAALPLLTWGWDAISDSRSA